MCLMPHRAPPIPFPNQLGAPSSEASAISSTGQTGDPRLPSGTVSQFPIALTTAGSLNGGEYIIYLRLRTPSSKPPSPLFSVLWFHRPLFCSSDGPNSFPLWRTLCCSLSQHDCPGPRHLACSALTGLPFNVPFKLSILTPLPIQIGSPL